MELSHGLGKLDPPGAPTVICPDARVKNLVVSRSALGDVHAAMNAGMPVSGRQTKSCQTAFALAFPLISYVRAVSRYCHEHDIQRVFFLSREGLFFKRLFDVTDQSGLDTHYLCVSRVSLLMLTIDKLNEAAVDRVLDLFEHHSHFTKVSIKQLLYILKIDNSEAFRIVRSLGHDVCRLMPFNDNREIFRLVLLDERMRLLFVRKRTDYLDLFLRYLNTFNLPDCGQVLLCDMGWSGSMQTYLASVLKKQGYAISLHGFYFGYDQTIDARKHAVLADNTVKTGYFVNDGTPAHLQEQQIINNLSLEVLASAGHGTVLSYRKKHGSVSPVFKHIPEEIWQHWRSIRPFQDLIVNYAQRYRAVFDEIARVYPEDEVYKYNLTTTRKLFYEPSSEFKHFLAFVFYDDFFGKNVRIKLAPYTPRDWRSRIRFGVRSLACRLAQYLIPPCLLDWLVQDDIKGCRCWLSNQWHKN